MPYTSPANIADCGCGCKGVSGLSYVDPRSGEFDYVAAAWDSAAQCASSVYDAYIAAYCTIKTGFSSWTDFLDPTNIFANSIECEPRHYADYPTFRKAFNCYQNLVISGQLPEPRKGYSVDGNWLNKVVPVVVDCAGILPEAAAAIFITFSKETNAGTIVNGPQFLWPKTYGELDKYRQEAENSGSIGAWLNKTLLNPIGSAAGTVVDTVKWVAIGAAVLGGIYLVAVAFDKAPSPSTVKQKFQ